MPLDYERSDHYLELQRRKLRKMRWQERRRELLWILGPVAVLFSPCIALNVAFAVVALIVWLILSIGRLIGVGNL